MSLIRDHINVAAGALPDHPDYVIEDRGARILYAQTHALIAIAEALEDIAGNLQNPPQRQGAW